MALLDSLQEILFTLRQNKLRSFLTAFGVFWGIFLLIVLLGAGQGLQKGAKAGFSTNANNTVFFWARKTSVPYKGLETGRRIHLKLSDVAALEREVTGIQFVSAEHQHWGSHLLSHGRNSGSFGIFGIADHFFKIKSGLEFPDGRRLSELDNDDARKVAIIGQPVADRLFPNSDSIGKYVSYGTLSFRVVGVFDDNDGNGRNAERIYLPSSLFIKTFGREQDHVTGISYIPTENADPAKVEADALALLKKRHRVAPSDRAAIRVHNIAEQKQRVDALFNGISIFIWFVGIGTLTAGIVGISNIMLITVKERTVEIGIRKALGARPFTIVTSLLFESVLITSIAGYCGLVAGVGLIELVSYLMSSSGFENDFFKNPEVNFAVAIEAILILVCVGALAGFVPAWRAARISPIEAMRSA